MATQFTNALSSADLSSISWASLSTNACWPQTQKQERKKANSKAHTVLRQSYRHQEEKERFFHCKSRRLSCRRVKFLPHSSLAVTESAFLATLSILWRYAQHICLVFFIRFILLFCAYECFAFLYVCAPHVCLVPVEVQGIRYSRNEVTSGWEPPWRYQESNLSPCKVTRALNW